MSKSADAFRTISEVADWLGIPAHVLRFWESKFTQVKPVKRAGGRRYYRPADMLLLGGIRKLLHDEGMTIKGVQKVMREQGVKYITSLSPELDGEMDMDHSDIALDVQPDPLDEDTNKVLPFDRPTERVPPRAAAPDETEDEDEADQNAPSQQMTDALDARSDDVIQKPGAPTPDAADPDDTGDGDPSEKKKKPKKDKKDKADKKSAKAKDAQAAVDSELSDPSAPKPAQHDLVNADDATVAHPHESQASPADSADRQDRVSTPKPQSDPLHADKTPGTTAATSPTTGKPPGTAAPAPRSPPVESPADPADDTPAPSSTLTALSGRARPLDAATAADLSRLTSRLSALRARLTGPRKG